METNTYTVIKEKCVGHVQKRMGSALNEYKKSKKGKILSDGKTVGGVGRLTEDVIKDSELLWACHKTKYRKFRRHEIGI